MRNKVSARRFVETFRSLFATDFPPGYGAHTLAAEGRQGLLSLRGEILLNHGGRNVLVLND